MLFSLKSWFFPRLCLWKHQDSWENKTNCSPRYHTLSVYCWPMFWWLGRYLVFIFFIFCTGTSKKYHEHLRRTALGKITDEIKLKNKKNLRKERVSLQLQCNERNRGHPTLFVVLFRKYLVAFSLMETNFSPQVPHLRLVRNERTLILLFWTRLVIGRKTLGGPSWVRYTVKMPVTSTNGGNDLRSRNSGKIHGAKFKV